MPEHSSLDDVTLSAYGLCLRAGVFSEDEIAQELGADRAQIVEIRKELVELRLLASAGPGRPLIPRDPEIAEAELASPLEEKISQLRKRIVGVHDQLRSAALVYRQGLSQQIPRQDASIRVLEDPEEVKSEIRALRRRCTTELMTVQPGGGRPTDVVRDVQEPTLAMLRRGVRMRTIYQHTARGSLATRAFVRQIREAGAEVRTAETLAERLIIYDRRTAVVPRERSSGGEPGAAIITDPTVVGFLCRYFEHLWVGGQPFDGGGADTDDGQHMPSDVRTAILRLMAIGLKDEVIARRLGMATRTCRRYIGLIMREVGAESRFQAGYEIGQQGLLALEPEATAGAESVRPSVPRVDAAKPSASHPPAADSQGTARPGRASSGSAVSAVPTEPGNP